MNPTNRAYGQALILAMHVGIAPRVPPIWGLLQHAWMPDEAFNEGERHSSRWPLIVFSTRNEEAARSSPTTKALDVVAIGDPFLYLDRLLRPGDAAPAAGAADGVIAYPSHESGSDETRVRHERYAAYLIDAEGTDVTVCLHGADHRNAALRGAYENLGLRVISHGSGHNPEFLFRQYVELLRHRRVVSNHVSTAIWHAAALGCHVEVSGPPFAPTPEHIDAIDRFQRERWPALHDGGVRGDDARLLAATELGADQLRAPGELAEALGWSGRRRIVARAATPVAAVRRRLIDRRTDAEEARSWRAELDQRWYDSFLDEPPR